MDGKKCIMADVYKFKVRLCELESKIWRDIEITSVSSVAKLGYLFKIKFKGNRYELYLKMIILRLQSIRLKQSFLR